jgi:histidyl-tRNA synthetase
MGLERILMLMEAVNAPIPNANPVKLYVASMGDDAYKKAYEIVTALRKKGVKAEVDHAGRGIKAQFKYADKIGAEYTLIIGDSELDLGRAQLKNMKKSEQREIEIDNIYSVLAEEI